MRRRLDSFADRGCWISHDRLYAFLSAAAGITEIGYHGIQPVSRNSRMLVSEEGVLRFSILDGEREIFVRTNVIDWEPSAIACEVPLAGGGCRLLIRASGRMLTVSCDGSSPVRVHLSKKGFFTAVHGERVWGAPEVLRDAILARCRDRVMLQAWLSRSGPYAGDFLIPEPVRRRIFATVKRSGCATRDDLRPEFRGKDIAIYDAEVFLRIGGAGFSVQDAGDEWVFQSSPAEPARFVVEFHDGPAGEAAPPPSEAPAGTIGNAGRREVPRIGLAGFPCLEEFARTVPGLVDSCVVQDFGIPRACPGRYYWIWAWDALVTMAEALRWGDAPGAGDTIRFIDSHRDEGGRIPGRWTRSLQPLDTPSPGGIDFLHASLAYETSLETGDGDLLAGLTGGLVPLFESVEHSLLERGFATGEGFYPDLLKTFGRSEESAVCMDVGSWYALCRTLENVSRLQGEGRLEGRARRAAGGVARMFSELFWDAGKGFFRDSIDVKTGDRSTLHPLFSLLFLHSPLGMGLVRPHIAQAGAFIARELMTPGGLRVLPEKESRPGGEAVLDAWYPHWDLYALKLLRRAGDAESIVRWMKQAEGVLEALGYCPEFLAMKGFRENAPDAWLGHGSSSNLNCVTSWFRALRESIAGFECDPGGITHVPLSLPVRSARVENLSFRGGCWMLESDYGGAHFESLTVDGTVIEGCLKIPAFAYTRGDHHAVARYGERPRLPCFTEIVNASVVWSRRMDDAVEIEIEPLGHVDLAFCSAAPPRLSIDGRETQVRWDGTRGTGYLGFTPEGVCRIKLVSSTTDR